MFYISLFVFFLLTIVLSVLRYTDSDYPFGIFKLFFEQQPHFVKYKRIKQMSTIQEFCAYIDDSLFLSLNLILYSIFDHLTLKTNNDL
jgi:hypothetical protein